MMETLLTQAFTLWGSTTSWLELLAFALSLIMVLCNMREIHWGWPLAMASSALYGALFWHSRLYGEAALQVFFIVMAVWGWWQWLRGGAQSRPLRVARLGREAAFKTLAACALLWPLTGLFLLTFTDTDVPWWDGFTTGLSLVGQALLGRKWIENWLVWLAVNVVSVGLFAWKGLWLTVLLYALFVVLSVAGYRAWQRNLTPTTA